MQLIVAAPSLSYGALLAAHPVTTNVMTACVLGLAGDAIAQSREHMVRHAGVVNATSGTRAAYDVRRGCSFATFNAVYRGGFQHFAFPALFSACQGNVLGPVLSVVPVVKGQQLSRALERMLVNQLFVVPVFFYPLFFLMSGWLQQLTPRESLLRARQHFKHLAVMNWSFWMPINLLQFLLLPARWQVACSCLCGFLWNAYLSLVAGSVRRHIKGPNPHAH
jgi:protein Mpv17